jgi:sugar phosphate isomerase/epimerase
MKSIRIGTLVHAKNAAAYIKEILPYGFESFSLTFGHFVSPEINFDQMASEIRDVIGDSGAVISSLGVYGNPIENQEQDIQTLRSWEILIDKAHLFGTDIVGGFTGRLRGRPIDQSIGRFSEIFTPLAKRALDKGVRIAFENCDMGGTWNTGDWNIAHTPPAWEMMFDSVRFENIGLEWEPCHQLIKLIDPLPQLRTWMKRIFHIHGKDATVKYDIIKQSGINGARQFAFHRTPGFGDSNWTDIISELRMGGYKGTIDIEGWHDPVYRGELEMSGQVHALNYLKWCRGGEYIKNPKRD